MSVPICYLNQCCNVVNSDLRNKLRWNLKRNSYIFRKENAFENVVCEMAAILSLLLYITSILKYSVRYSYINQPKWTRLFLLYSLGLPHWRWSDSGWYGMLTSSNGNIFYVTGPLRRESIGNRWIPLTKASDAELWYFLWSAPEQSVE